MTTAQDHAKSVVLNLSAVLPSGAEVALPERRIKLTEDRNTITIGRASKVATKGFVAGVDNAWFDTPVMSRLHARFAARMNENKVEIMDLNSLHGTFLNGDERIPSDRWRELRDGDILRFGAPIWRGTQQFLPATVKVGLNFNCGDNTGTGAFGPGTFQVPDDSEDDAASDDGRAADRDAPAKIKARNPAVQRGSISAVPAHPAVIDLTGGHGDRNSHRVVVDLSNAEDDNEASAMPVDSQHERREKLADHRSAGPQLAEFVSMDGTAALPHLDDIFSDGFNPVDERAAWYDPDGDEDATNSPSPYSDDSELDYQEEDYEWDSEMAGYDEAEGECDDDVGETESDEEYSSDDDELDLNSLYDHGPWDDVPQSLEDIEYPEIIPLVNSLSRPTETSLPVSQSQTAPRNTTGFSIERLLNADKPLMSAPASCQERDQAGQQLPAINCQTLGAATMTPALLSCASAATTPAEALGAKTGKTEYFLAREENKMKMSAPKSAGPRPASSVHALCNADEPVDEPSTYRFGPAGQQTEASSAPSPMITEAAGSSSSATILSSLPVQNAQLDGSRRTHVGISDIVDTQQPTPCEGKLKRKADDISETTEEQEAWAAKTAKAHSPAPPLPEQQHESLEQHAEPEPEAEVHVEVDPEPMAVDVVAESSKPARQDTAFIAPSYVPERPVKRARMMRVAERLGYAALGGVTAGAMIVGTLIYTAPTFG